MRIIIYLYLTLPMLIFVIGYLRWYWALLFGSIIFAAFIRAVKNDEWADLELEKGKRGSIVLVCFLILIWVFLSGIGGLSFQNPDHTARNAIFKALVEYEWPVMNEGGTIGLIYYIGFWMPAAVVGKLTCLRVGYLCQVLWACLGIGIVYYLLCVYRKKVDLKTIIFLIFFSGLDLVGKVCWDAELFNILSTEHIEWWSKMFQYSSNTTQLFWVFNQSIPAWIATILILNQKKPQNVFYILSLIMLTSTFPFVGLIPFAVYIAIRDMDKHNLKALFSYQNIVGVVFVGGLSFLYLAGSFQVGRIDVSGSKGGNSLFVVQDVFVVLYFYLIEVGLYSIFIYRYKKRDIIFWIANIVLLLCPFIKVGISADFCMRASIPALFVIMLYLIDVFEKMIEKKEKRLLAILIIVILIGGVTPFLEIHRSIKESYNRRANNLPVMAKTSDIETNILQLGNFGGEIEHNFFFNYLAK